MPIPSASALTPIGPFPVEPVEQQVGGPVHGVADLAHATEPGLLRAAGEEGHLVLEALEETRFGWSSCPREVRHGRRLARAAAMVGEEYADRGGRTRPAENHVVVTAWRANGRAACELRDLAAWTTARLAPCPVTLDDVRGAPEDALRGGPDDRDGGQPAPVRAGRAHRCTSSARTCSAPARSSCAAPTCGSPGLRPEERAAGRGRGERRQPRAGGGAGRRAARGALHRLHAGRRAAAEGRRDPGVRRRGAAARAGRRRDAAPPRRSTPTQTGAVFIHPFDHPDIIAGQGTVGLEILEQCPEVRTIVVGRRRRRTARPASRWR